MPDYLPPLGAAAGQAGSAVSAKRELDAGCRVPREGEACQSAADKSGCSRAGDQGQGPAGPQNKRSIWYNPGTEGLFYSVVNKLVITFIVMLFLKKGPNYSCF